MYTDVAQSKKFEVIVMIENTDPIFENERNKKLKIDADSVAIAEVKCGLFW